MLLIAIALFPQLTDDPGQLWTISLLVNIMFKIQIFTLSKILTLVEIGGGFLFAMILIGLGYQPVTNWYDYLLDLIFLGCLALEFWGIQMKINGLNVFSCVFRCICLIVSFFCFIGVIVFDYLHKSESITESEFVEIVGSETEW